MFRLALLLGLYSYTIFFIGVAGFLTRQNIIGISLVFAVLSFKFLPKFSFPKLSKFSWFLLSLLVTQCLINLIGALGPELGFDALWYHLTLPKIWLEHGRIFFLPGSTFKYSVMPMLTEMSYFLVPGKLVHYFYGLLALGITFKLARKYLNQKYSLLATLLMSANLVFGWESTSGYIDLSRTFFETAALYLFLDNQIYKSAITLGFAVCTKLLAITSLPIYLLMLVLKKARPQTVFIFTLLVIAVVSPWLIRAYLSTGNPVYPFFTPLYNDTQISLDPKNLLRLFIHAADPINLIYILTLPLVIFVSKNKYLTLYGFLGLIVWILVPNTGGGRFILPYLPVLSIISASVIYYSKSAIKTILTILAIVLSLFSIAYRFAANLKYLSPKTQLLCSRLNFSFGDFYDCDGRLAKAIQPSSHVLTLGINNLYYANFIYDYQNFDYILIREPDAKLPDQFSSWQEIYKNAITNVRLLKRP